MIKNYLELNKEELSSVYEFINRNKEIKENTEDIRKRFEQELYNAGEGVLFYFLEERVVCKIEIILKETKSIGVAYIVGFDILEEDSDIDIIEEIVRAGSKIAQTQGAKDIYLGLGNKDIVSVLERNNIGYDYLAIKMKLKNKKLIHKPLLLKELTKEEIGVYVEIHNDAFKYVTNGATVTDKEVEENLKMKDENKFYYIVRNEENENIGMLEITIDDNSGSFDLGLKKEFRNKGYGKRLLETAIDYLNKDNRVEETNLIVMSKNTIAYNMYKKRGFEDKEVFSYWYDAKKLNKTGEELCLNMIF